MIQLMKRLSNSTKLASLLILLIILSQSCNVHVEKRRYRKGYYVEVSKKNKRSDIDPIQSTSTKIDLRKSETVRLNTIEAPQIDSVKQLPLITKNQTLVHNKKNIFVKRPDSKFHTKKKAGGDECDVIHLLDGTEIEALIVTISETEIAYKKCNFIDGPTYKISSGKIRSIDLKNGEVYTPDPAKNSSTSEVTGGMIATIILGGIALICIIIAMILLFSFSFGYGLVAAIPLAIAGITSLVGLILGTRFLKKEAHGLGKAGFYANLALQVLAIIFTVLMFLGI